MTILRVPVDFHDAVEHRRQIANGVNALLEDFSPFKFPEWATAGDIPTTPGVGEAGLVTFGATTGAGLYYYDGTAWQKVTVTAGTLP